MVALIVGLLLILFCVFACLPAECLGFGLNWGNEVLSFLRGFAPVLAAFVGLVAVFVGFADIKDKREAKKEEEASKEEK
ncbi:MAG: hypothetical protein J6Z17_06930 [Treponema sp.]|nr:hypothetical protein [Treponema sp.]